MVRIVINQILAELGEPIILADNEWVDHIEFDEGTLRVFVVSNVEDPE